MNVEKAQEEILKERTLILSNRQKVNKSNATLSLLIDFFSLLSIAACKTLACFIWESSMNEPSPLSANRTRAECH